MSPRLFVRLFVYLAMIFVPVYFVYGPTRLVTPCSYILFAFLFEQSHHYQAWSEMIGELLPVLFYGFVFYAAARLISVVTQRIAARHLRIVVQATVLATLFSCSFLRVIGRETSWSQSGKYTFWSACGRYQDKLPRSWPN